MIAMIFEVWPKSEHRQDYLDTAAVLRPLLDGIEGFISIGVWRTSHGPALNRAFAICESVPYGSPRAGCSSFARRVA
jgi:hypothetical protein